MFPVPLFLKRSFFACRIHIIAESASDHKGEKTRPGAA